MKKDNGNIILFVTVSALFIAIIYSIPGWIFIEYFLPDSRDEIFPYVIGISQLLFMLLPAVLLGMKLPFPYSDTFRLKGRPGINLYLAGIVALIAIRVFSIGYMTIQEAIIPDFLLEYYEEFEKIIEEAYSGLLKSDTPSKLALSLIIGALLPALCEEFLFRGYLQSSLEKKLPPVISIAFSSFLFTMVHINPVEFIPLMMISILLGTSAFAGKSLKVPIILHFINNALVVVAMYFSAGATESMPDMKILPATALTAGGLVLFALSIIYIYRNRL